MADDPRQCSECGARLMAGWPLHKCISTIGGVTRELYWCVECAEYISSASWDHETKGPYPFTVTNNEKGRA